MVLADIMHNYVWLTVGLHYDCRSSASPDIEVQNRKANEHVKLWGPYFRLLQGIGVALERSDASPDRIWSLVLFSGAAYYSICPSRASPLYNVTNNAKQSYSPILGRLAIACAANKAVHNISRLATAPKIQFKTELFSSSALLDIFS